MTDGSGMPKEQTVVDGIDAMREGFRGRGAVDSREKLLAHDENARHGAGSPRIA